MRNLYHKQPNNISKLRQQSQAHLITVVQTYLLKKLEQKIMREQDKQMKERNNTQVDTAKDLDAVMHMCNLIEYSDNHSIICGKKSSMVLNGN